jgi:DNA-binding beta-propeller fold protein YncE
MTSISTGGKYYWAKALSNKVDQGIHGVKFSTDGALLIAHNGFSSSNFIIVFNVRSGNILSARKY